MSETVADEVEVQEPRKRGLFRRGEDGLTTLEWLLIVAAVAGLAALAVVLVQNVVDDTAEQISGSSARETAAKVAAADITTKAHNAGDTTSLAASTDWDALEADYENECNRLEITYGDIPGLSSDWDTASALTKPATYTAAAAVTAWQAGLDDTSTEGCQIS